MIPVECERCGKGAEEKVLLKYPFTVSYKNIESTDESEEEYSYICFNCLEKEYVEEFG